MLQGCVGRHERLRNFSQPALSPQQQPRPCEGRGCARTAAEDFPRRYAYFTAVEAIYAERAMGPAASKLRAKLPCDFEVFGCSFAAVYHNIERDVLTFGQCRQSGASLLPNSKVDSVTALPADSPSGPEGSVKVVEFTMLKLFAHRRPAVLIGALALAGCVSVQRPFQHEAVAPPPAEPAVLPALPPAFQSGEIVGRWDFAS
jgi:hypothetical protein